VMEHVPEEPEVLGAAPSDEHVAHGVSDWAS
jgi:hypothetical protein